MTRTRTDPATIRRALDIADKHNPYRAQTELGIDHQTVRRWIARRATEHPAWPTPDDIAAWRADNEAKAAHRARKSANQAARRKRQYLRMAPPLTPSIGTTRRVRALYALGWTCVDMGRELGVSKEQIARSLRGDFRQVKQRTVERVAKLYALMSMTIPTDPPPVKRGDTRVHERARRDAKARGYAPPLAWDDDTIDDPDATPTLGTAAIRPGGGKPIHELIEDVEFLLQHDPFMTSTELAHRLGYADKSGVQNALAADRGNRPDLLAQLARNAEVKAA